MKNNLKNCACIHTHTHTHTHMGFPSGKKKKSLPNNARYARDMSSIRESGRYPGVGSGNPLQYSCLGEFHRQRSLEGYSPWGCKRVRHNLTTDHTHAFKLKVKKNSVVYLKREDDVMKSENCLKLSTGFAFLFSFFLSFFNLCFLQLQL